VAATEKGRNWKTMANALATKINTFRNSSFLTFIRTLSTSSSDAAASASATTKKSKRRKKKNFFEVAQFLPNWGIGYHMAKTHWQEVSYEITKLNLYKVLLISSHFIFFSLQFHNLIFIYFD
jgi:predicted DNA-binding protein (MmcQ/YjbR family)